MVKRCASVPSSEAAYRLVEGDVGALGAVAGTMVLRAGLVGAGLYVAGERDPKTLAKYAAAGSVAIEAFVLAWALYKTQGGGA
jgi:hypothetical protein